MDRPAFSYRFGTAEFDEARFELRVAGLPVEVERRALEVLLYLLRHAGEVATKEELLSEVWAGRITVDKVLPNAINKLRRALGEANADLVSTQARIGYRLDGVVTRVAVGRTPTSELAFEAGQPVPGRRSFALVRQLGRTAGSEVWLAEHGKTREQRVYKFALDGERLRSLKREATLMRVLRESLDSHEHFVDIIDWNFEQAPYFLECGYGGIALGAWAEQHLAQLSGAARIALFVQIADAVADAHSVGVLHKDLKPANVLVSGDAATPQVRLTDFGSGHLLEPDRLEQLGITRLGMTVDDQSSGSTSGTPFYLAPELFAGQAPTVKSDVYALGMLLYQLLSGRIGQPMAPGWEADIDDALLREDLQHATDGNPERRMASAGELASRLRRLEQRHLDRVERDQLAAQALRDREALARTRARQPIVATMLIVLAVGVIVAVWLQRQAVAARAQAQQELARATALTRFLNDDLIGRSNPLVTAKGADATLREVLLSARERVASRFTEQPATEATVRANLAVMLNTLDLFEDAEHEARVALGLQEQHDGAESAAALQTRIMLARILTRRGKLDEAESMLAEFERLVGPTPDDMQRQMLAAAHSTLYIGRSQFDKALVSLRAAIDGLDARDSANTGQRDSLRLDLIAVLALSRQDELAREQGQALIAEARTRREDTALLIALTQVAMARAYREDHDMAEKLLLEARPVIVAKLGDQHTKHLHLLGELLSVAFRRGDWPRAAEYAQLVHERARVKFGDRHALTYVTLANWARTLSESGQAAAAADKGREAYTRLRELAGPDSPQTQDAGFVYALAELDLGHVAPAEPVIAELDPAVLESGRATGLWPHAVDILRGIALAQRGERAAALAKLDPAIEAITVDIDLAAPERLYVVATSTRARLR
jgi:non-specific serine/threonine protein kinase